MTTAIQTTLFDYGALDTMLRVVVQQRIARLHDKDRKFGGLMRQTIETAWEMGEELYGLQQDLDHGLFLSCIRSEFPHWGKSSAYNFINVYKNFTFPTVGNLEIGLRAAYLLAAPSTPESAREEAISRAEQGEPIGYTVAREMVNNHRNPPLTDEEEIEEQIETRRYDGWPMDVPPEDRRDNQRRQQITVITSSSESNEWYTPTHIIAQAREALGGIDFDPASTAAANAVIQAESYCTIEENGYAQPWYGRVWLNPPYGKEEGERETNAVRWSRKLIAEYEARRVEAAILLVKAALGYNWFEELWRLYPTCLLRERLSFIRPDGSNDGQSKHATALLYIGEDINRFRDAFQPLGRIILPE